MSKKDIDSIIDEVMANIRNDREVTKELLGDAMSWLSKDESRHREIGIVLSKYVETLQRSNEQLVKIANMVSKDTKSRGLSDEDKSDLLDMISGDKEDV
tara:strand:+ start:602 stop:898 length:297 start_codon:yes stop_codon:yes gene_type:complete